MALHLLKEENDHIEVHDLRGFVAQDLVSALDEAHAMSKSTRAKQYLFSLSLNPPKDAKVSTHSFKEAIEQILQECWASCDGKTAFAQALKSRGYCLAKGDRRGFVAIDHQCNIFSIPKWLGLKTKEVKAKLGKADELPCVQEAKNTIAQTMMARLDQLQDKQDTTIHARLDWVRRQNADMRTQHRKERAALEQKQAKR